MYFSLITKIGSSPMCSRKKKQDNIVLTRKKEATPRVLFIKHTVEQCHPNK